MVASVDDTYVGTETETEMNPVAEKKKKIDKSNTAVAPPTPEKKMDFVPRNLLVSMVPWCHCWLLVGNDHDQDDNAAAAAGSHIDWCLLDRIADNQSTKNKPNNNKIMCD